MAALSTGTYGKAPIMSVQATLTGLADRLTAILAAAHAAIGELNSGVATGAPVNQAHVNTLTKVMQDLGELATAARQAAADAAQKASEASAPDAPQQGSARASGTGTAKA